MSILSDTQGSAERIWSLLRLLAANDGAMDRQDILNWMAPSFGSDPTFSPSGQATAATQTLGAASSLGLLKANGNVYTLAVAEVPDSIDAFADAVHRRLCEVPTEHADAVVLEAYAAILVLTERHAGTHWIRERSTKELADTDLAEILRTDDQTERRFNSTKYSHWIRWVSFVGLGLPQTVSGGRSSAFYPTLTERLERELSLVTAEFSGSEEWDVPTFLERLGQRMPYLDGGVLFDELRERAGLRPMGRRLSRVLSNALCDLHDDGVIELVTVGDTAGMYELANTKHPVRAITAIRLLPQRGPQ